MRQEPYVAGELLGALGDTGEHRQCKVIHLSGVGLATDGVGAGKPGLLHHLFLQSLYLLPVAPKEFQEAGAGAGGATAAQKFQVAQAKVQLLEIQHQILHPQCGPLAHGCGLSRLEVSIGKSGQVFIFLSKVSDGSNGV